MLASSGSNGIQQSSSMEDATFSFFSFFFLLPELVTLPVCQRDVFQLLHARNSTCVHQVERSLVVRLLERVLRGKPVLMSIYQQQ